MTAHLKHEGPDAFVICKPCDVERHENNPKRAQRLVTEHNHSKHKEN